MCGSRRLYRRGVPPFGYPRIYDCLRLPVAFRSWPRPSSPPGARASSLCSSLLDLCTHATLYSVAWYLGCALQRNQVCTYGVLDSATKYVLLVHCTTHHGTYVKIVVLISCRTPLPWRPALCQCVPLLLLVLAFTAALCGFQGPFPGPPGLVEIVRLELTTPCVQGRCSPN